MNDIYSPFSSLLEIFWCLYNRIILDYELNINIDGICVWISRGYQGAIDKKTGATKVRF